MSIYATLADLQKAADKENSGGGGRQYLTVKAGQSFRVRFRQELTQDGKNYSEDAGTGLIVPVHTSPFDFKKKLACTIEDEAFDFRCWPHEQVVVNKKFRDTKHMVMNVAVLDDNEWTNRLFDQTFSPKHVIVTLIEYASEYGTITDRDYKITRTGTGMNDTQYQLIPLDPKPASPDIADLELYDLNDVYRKLPYDEQIEFFAAEAPVRAAASNW